MNFSNQMKLRYKQPWNECRFKFQRKTYFVFPSQLSVSDIKNLQIFKHILQFKYKMMKIIALLSFLLLITQSSRPEIKLDNVYSFELPGMQVEKFELVIPAEYYGMKNLYISAYSLINDPFEEPIMQISSDKYSMKCDSEETDLNDICFVPFEKISPGQKFMIDMYCQIDCKAKLVAYLGETLELDLGDEVQISSGESPLEKSFKIYIPPDIQFDEIQVKVKVVSSFNEFEGTNMYFNFGENPSIPTQSNHTKVRQQDWGSLKGYYISPADGLEGGNWIAVTINIGIDSILQINSQSYVGIKREMGINQLVDDYVEDKKMKIYEISLDEIRDRQVRPIFIDFIQYSGKPQVQFSYDEQFIDSKRLYYSGSTWVRFQIDEQTQKNSDLFKFKVFVKVTGIWSCSYAIRAQINFKNFISLQEDIRQFISVPQKSVVELVFEDYGYLQQGNQTKIKRQISLDRFKGSNVQVAIFVCQKEENNSNKQINVNNCIQQDPNSLYSSLSSDISFVPSVGSGYKLKRLQVQRADTFATFNQEFTDCFKSQMYQGVSLVTCEYLIMLYPNSTAKSSVNTLSVAIKSMNYPTELRQGTSSSTAVDIKQYRYFTFSLTDVNDISNVLIYANTLSGNIKILSSLTISNPTLQNITQRDIKLEKDKISYNNSQLNGKKIYIGVYGLQYSDFVINVIVHRTSQGSINNTVIDSQSKLDNGEIDITDIELIDGQTQKYSLEIGENRMNFKYAAKNIGNIQIKVIELTGKVKTNVEVFSSQTSDVKSQFCPEGQCSIDISEEDSSVRVSVFGRMQTSQEFTILLSESGKCYTFPVGTPLRSSLQPNKTDCVRDTVNKNVGIQIQNSLSALQMLRKAVSFQIFFPSTQMVIEIDTNSYIITPEDLNRGCPRDDRECEIQYRMSAGQQEINFYTIIQRVDGFLYMYDGVAQNIDAQISSSKGRYFAYHYKKLKNTDIFFKSVSSSNLVLYANLISHDKLNSTENSFPTQQNSLWKLNINRYSTIESLHITKDQIKDYMQKNNVSKFYLVISVFGKESQLIENQFSLEITQDQRILREGSRQIGFISEGEIIQYEIYPSQSSIFTAHAVNADKCFEIVQSNNTLEEGPFGYQLKFNNSENSPIYLDLAIDKSSKSCMYVVSLQNFEDNLLQVQANFPTKINLQNKKIQYFLYHHNQNQKFRVFQLISSGSSEVFVTPVTPEMLEQGFTNISSLLQLSEYKYIGKQSAYLQIQPTSQYFCYNCYYIIAVKASPQVNEEIVINMGNSPITIKEKTLVDASLKANEEDLFLYYSSEDQFNITLGLIYGGVNIQVYQYGNQQNKVTVFEKSFQEKKTIQIPIELPSASPHQKYIIKVSALRDSSYHMQITNFQGKLVLSQGVPLKIDILSSKTEVQFDSIVSSGTHQLLIFTNSSLKYLKYIKCDIQFTEGNVERGTYQNISSRLEMLGKGMRITFQAMRGHYKINLYSTAGMKFQSVLIIPKAGLSQLIAQSRFVGSKEGIYEIYIPENFYAMIQLFQCMGQVKLRGSADYDQIANAEVGQNQVSLTHLNIGGHYVINAKNLTGLYYLRVQDKNIFKHINQADTQLEYMIRYRLIKNGIPNPYQLIDALDLQLQSVDDNGPQLVLNVHSVLPLEPRVVINKIQYMFTLGRNVQDLENIMICSTDSLVQKLSSYTPKDYKQETTSLHLQKLKLMKNMGKKQAFASVLATAEIDLSDAEADGHFEDVIFVYQPQKLNRYIKKTVFSSWTFIQIAIIIILFTGAIVLVYTLWHEGLIKIMGYQAHAGADLVEQDNHKNDDEDSTNKIQNSSEEQVVKKE